MKTTLSEVMNALTEAGAQYHGENFYAKDFGLTLINNGFEPVYGNNSPQVGDIAIIQPWGGHNSGHMEMYDGTQWISDWKQGSSFYPWSGAADAENKPIFTIYRLP